MKSEKEEDVKKDFSLVNFNWNTVETEVIDIRKWKSMIALYVNGLSLSPSRV